MNIRHMTRVVAVGLTLQLSLVLFNAAAGAAPAPAPSPDTASRAIASTAMIRVKASETMIAPGSFPYYTKANSWVTSGPNTWISGYLPGQLWASYALGGDGWFAKHAASRQVPLARTMPTSASLDIGIRYFYSYAQGYRLTGNTAYKAVAMRAAAIQAQRFNPIVGALRSTNATSFEVIADDLMNIQLLRWGADNGGPSSWRRMARQHALTTAHDFIRADGSTFHRVTYDAATGHWLDKGTKQGYADDSMWARGQAWAIYGFAAEYRASQDTTLLAAARMVSDRYIADLPSDQVPYWDFRAPTVLTPPRDSSSAAIAAAGLLDLATLDPDLANRSRYAAAATEMLRSLESTSYLSASENPAIIAHGTMAIWNPATVDVGLSFGDYFFLESLLRLRALPTTSTPLRIRHVSSSSGKARAAVDGRASTACVLRGKQYVQLDLGKKIRVRAVSLALRYGSSRSAPLKVYASSDKRHWVLVLRARTSGLTSNAETYVIARTSARYLRFAMNGCTRGKVNGVSEVRAY